jgi:hypothetical protein
MGSLARECSSRNIGSSSMAMRKIERGMVERLSAIVKPEVAQHA